MPTRGRPELAAKAVEYFWAQTWPNKELLIMDDGRERSFTMRPDCDVYLCMNGPMTIGTKRNALCVLAKGEIIVHWDSDDYSSPERLQSQYEILTASVKAVTGFYTLLFVNEESKEAARYIGDPSDTVGTSLMYMKDWWEKHPFEDVMIQEDIGFARVAYQHDQLHAVPSDDSIIARVHQGNTSPDSSIDRLLQKAKSIVGENWQTVEFQPIP